jgi:hypothetical protein
VHNLFFLLSQVAAELSKMLHRAMADVRNSSSSSSDGAVTAAVARLRACTELLPEGRLSALAANRLLKESEDHPMMSRYTCVFAMSYRCLQRWHTHITCTSV